MENKDILTFHYLVEFDHISKIEILNIDKDFPGFAQACASSKDFSEYKECIVDCVDFIRDKAELLNQENDQYKVYWIKNNFSKSNPDWEYTELAKIYIANESQDVYNAPFVARVFFSKDEPEEIEYDTSFFIKNNNNTLQ